MEKHTVKILNQLITLDGLSLLAYVLLASKFKTQAWEKDAILEPILSTAFISRL